ncbi:MAG: hypothetical protein KAS32_18285 [Candidatus Peribacteraceae bacterium]|nr:hypothetical protein [Candidatus Peribacteraceae bacterium]
METTKTTHTEMICIFCKYLSFSEAFVGYSEYTPGHEASMYCTKGKWAIDFFDLSTEEYRETMLTAETCGEYFPAIWDKI